MGRRRKLSDEQEREVVARTRRGETWAVVGGDFGIATMTVGAVLKRHGALKKQDPTAVDCRRRSTAAGPARRRGGAAMDDSEWMALLRRRLEGEDLAALAAEAGVSVGAIRWRAKTMGMRFEDHGLAPPRKRGTSVAPPEVRNPGKPAVLHPAQRPPAGDWATWLFLGGRGAGKTTAGARWISALAEAEPGGTRLALVGATLRDVREVMVDGPAGLRTLPGAVRPRWEAGRGRLSWPNGSYALAFSADAPERLRGPQFDAAWADEFCAWAGDPGDTLAQLRMGLRLGDDPRLAVTTTPKPLPCLRALMAEPRLTRTHAPTGANAANLAPAFLETLEAAGGEGVERALRPGGRAGLGGDGAGRGAGAGAAGDGVLTAGAGPGCNSARRPPVEPDLSFRTHTPMNLPKGALVAVCDGSKLSLFKNAGDGSGVNLTALNVPDVDDENMGSGGRHHSSAANPDDSTQDEDAYAAGIAALLNKRVLSGNVDALLVIAAPRTLGELRRGYHAKLKDVLVGELAKDLAGRPIPEIEAAIARG